MKKLLFTVLLFASITASGQTNSFPSSGNVRINTSNSDANLTMEGTFLVGGNAANIDPAHANSGLNNLANSAKMLIGWNRTAGDGEADFISNRGGGGIGGFAFYDYSNSSILTSLMRISGNGNVGIGTSSPSEKLSVNGNIRAKEVKVETASWPDYVFAIDYKLPTLQETERFILKNKHLPSMPSAQYVEKHGQNLGEMNAKLLKTVEELTLHLIQKDKQLKDQENRIRAQELRMSKIEKLLKDKVGN